MKRTCVCALVVLAGLGLALPVPAAVTWDVTPGDGGAIADGGGNWSNGGGNWNNGDDTTWNNDAADQAIIGGGTSGAAGTIALASGITAGGLTFNAANGGAFYTISGNTLTLSGTPTITANVNATIGSLIAGSAPLIKDGAGTLTLTGGNGGFSGNVTINAGTLYFNGGGNAYPLGQTAARTVTINGATFTAAAGCHNPFGTGANVAPLIMIGGTYNSAEYNHMQSIDMTGGIIQPTGVQADGLDMKNTPTVTTHANATSATIASKMSFNGGNVTFAVEDGAAATDLLVSGTSVGSSGLIKSGPGTLTLTGPNSYGGGTTVNGGTLLLGYFAGGIGTVKGTVTVNAGYTLNYTVANAFGYTSGSSVNVLNIVGGTVGGLDLQNHFWNTFQLNMTGGTLYLGGTGAAPNEFHTVTVTVNASPDTAQIRGVTTSAQLRLRDSTPAVFNVADGANAVDLLVDCQIVQNGTSTLTKNGAGTMVLRRGDAASGPWTYNSAVIAAGTLQFDNTKVGGDGPQITRSTVNNATMVLSNGNTGNLDLNANVSGTGALIKTGTGPVRLATYSAAPVLSHAGDTTIQTGLVSLQGQNTFKNINSTGNFVVNAGATFSFDGNGGAAAGFPISVGALQDGVGGGGTIQIGWGGAHYLSIGNGDKSGSFGGVVQSAVVLTKVGAGTQILTGNNTYSGGTTISGGTLQVGNGGSGARAGAGNITDNATLVFNHADGYTYGYAISGTGSVRKQGSAILTLNTANSFSGGTFVDGGTLRVIGNQTANRLANGSTVTINNTGTFLFDEVNALPTGANAVSFTVNPGGTLTFGQANHAHVGNLVMNGGNVTGQTMGGGKYNGEDFQLDGNVTVGGAQASSVNLEYGISLDGARTFNVADATGSPDADLTLQGNATGGILQNRDGGVVGQVVKTGAGTLTVAANSTYTGATTINGGTLLVNGTHNGGGAYTVNDTGILGGSGIVGSAVNVSSGGTLAPGGTNAPANFTVNSGVTFVSGATYHVNIQPGGSDKLSLSGALNLNGATLRVVLPEHFYPVDVVYTIATGFSSLDANFFDGLPEGKEFLAGGAGFIIHYNAGASPKTITLAARKVDNGTLFVVR